MDLKAHRNTVIPSQIVFTSAQRSSVSAAVIKGNFSRLLQRADVK